MSTSSPIRPRVFLSAAWLLSASVAWGIGCTAGSDPAPGDGTGGGGANLNTRDTDGDGIVDALDPDIDNDGIPNESDPDVDGDGIPNESDPDFPRNNIGGDGDINPVDGSSGTGGGGPVTECKIVDGVEVCSCFKLITWGALGTFGAVPGQDGQDAITKWLNDNSSGCSTRQGTHQVAKKLTTTHWPRNESRSKVSPVDIDSPWMGGATSPTRGLSAARSWLGSRVARTTTNTASTAATARAMKKMGPRRRTRSDSPGAGASASA